MGGGQRARKIVEQTGEVSRQRRRPRDQNIVMPLPAMKRKNSRGGGPKPSFRPVAGHCIADLAAGGETDPDMAANRRGRGAKFHGQACGRAPDTPRGAQEIWTIFKAVHDGHARPAARVRRRVFCGHAHGGAPAPCVRRPWPCANGSHGAACGQSCSADRDASWLNSRDFAGPLRKSAVSRGVGRTCQPIGAVMTLIPKIGVIGADFPFGIFI